MNRSLIRKTVFIVAVVLVSIFAIWKAQLRKGLDLQGGASLILRVRVDSADASRQREAVEQTRQILDRRIHAFGLAETPVQPYRSRGNKLLVQLQA